MFQQGEKIGTVTEYSDTLLALLLKATKKEKYQDRSKVLQRTKATVTATIVHSDTANTDLSRLSDTELEQLEALLEKANAEPKPPPSASVASGAAEGPARE